MKRLTIIMAIVLLGVIWTTVFKMHSHAKTVIQATKLPAIVRLIDVRTGRFFCTGFVVSDSYLITAAHCLEDRVIFNAIVLPSHPKGIEVRDMFGNPSGATIRDTRYESRSDQGLLVGNFSMFNKLPVVTSPQSFITILPNAKLTSCGFPYAGKLFCSPMQFVSIFDFYISATGLGMWPGMSGGPVIDQETGFAIGINTGVLGDKFVLATTVNLFNNLGIISQ